MIFLSHNWKDKPIIGQFDKALIEVFGRENVFYDSWSIQPGDGIIDEMGIGLQNCKYFFFFVSRNSLASPMVKLEWQNALMRAAKNETMKFVPIRVDKSDVPVLLLQKAWIDLYSVGLKEALRQVIDVCSGKNIYEPPAEEFSNLHAYTANNGSKCEIRIEAVHFTEPIASFGFFFSNSPDEIAFSMPSEPVHKRGSHSNIPWIDGKTVNAQMMALDKPMTPGHPFKVEIQVKEGATLDLLSVMHEHKKNDWVVIKVTAESATS